MFELLIFIFTIIIITYLFVGVIWMTIAEKKKCPNQYYCPHWNSEHDNNCELYKHMNMCYKYKALKKEYKKIKKSID